jgi:diacylglycerol kinase family enzyme
VDGADRGRAARASKPARVPIEDTSGLQRRTLPQSVRADRQQRVSRRHTSFGTREALDRGELCLYVARAQSRLALLWLGFRCTLGIVDQQRDLRILKTQTAEIGARKRRLLVAFDGEVESILSPLRYRTRPGALRIFAPRTDR